MVKIKKTANTKYYQDVGQLELSYPASENIKWYKYFRQWLGSF